MASSEKKILEEDGERTSKIYFATTQINRLCLPQQDKQGAESSNYFNTGKMSSRYPYQFW
jgi:hypothetical protein